MSSLTPIATLHGTIAIASGGGSEPVLEDVTVKSGNSQQTVVAGEGYDGIGEVTVEPIALQSKNVTPTSSQQVVTADSGYDGLSSVTVGAVTGGYDFVMRGPDNLVTLPEYMFYQDTNIRTFTGKSGAMGSTTITEKCFYGCTNLEAVYLPSSGNFRGYDYFDNCPKLKDVYIAVADATSVPTIENPDEFSDIERIHVPADQLADFQASSSFSRLLDKLVGDYVV